MSITVEELEILVRARVEEALKDLSKVKAQMQNLFNAPEMQKQIQQMQNSLKQLVSPMQKMQAESAKYQAMGQVAAQKVQQQVAKTLAAQAKAQAEQAKSQAIIDKSKAASEKAIAQQKAQEARNAQQVAQDRARAEEVIQQQRDIEEAVARATARLEQQNKSLSDGPVREPVSLTGAAPTVTPLGNVQDYLNKNADKYAASINRIREEIGKINGSGETDLEVLNRKIELLKQKLAQLKEAYEKALNAPNPDNNGLEKMEGQILSTEGQLNRMIRQSDRLAESLNRAEEAKKKLDGGAGKNDLVAGINRVKEATNKALSATKKYGATAVQSAAKAKGAFLKLGQVIKRVMAAAVLYKGFRALFGFIRDGISSAISAPEIQNMFDVAFKNAAASAEAFAQRLKKAFGVDIMESKQMLATMQNFTTSMGIGEKTSFKMSTSLTQLAYDMASLYEADPSQVFENMQSGLQGMPRAMYKYGVSLTAANIEQTALQYGLIKSGQEMTDHQKIIARYLTILKQTSNAQGDMSRTMQSPANMLRVLKSQLTAAGRAIGNAFMPFIQAVLPWLNALAVLLERVGNALATFTYSLFGRDFKAEQKQQQNIAGGFGDIADAEKDVADNAKKAKNALAGFDELEVIQKNTDTGGNGGAGAGGYEWDVPTLDWPKGESPYEKMADTIVEKLKAIQEAIRPTIDALGRLWNQLKVVGDFAWEGLQGFYDNFLAPLGKWTFGEGLPRFFDITTKMLKDIDWQKINNALNDFWRALEPFAENVGEGLLWAYENIFVPFATWTMNEFVPAFLEALAAILESPVWVTAGEALKEIYNNFFKPIANWAGDKIIEFLDWISTHGDEAAAAIIGIGAAFATWKIGKGVFKIANWTKETKAVKGLSKAFQWLKRKVTGVDKSMESKNKTLETQTDDTQKETSKVWNWIPALAAAGAGAAALGKSLEDNLGSFKMPDWELPDFGGYSLPSPVFSPAVAPAIDMSSLFQPSVREYQLPISAPSFFSAIAPMIDKLSFFIPSMLEYLIPIAAPSFAPIVAPAIDTLTSFVPTLTEYLLPIEAPTFEPIIAPAIDTDKLFNPSVEEAKSTLQDFVSETEQSVVGWKTNLSSNFSTLADFLLQVISIKIPMLAPVFKSAFHEMSNNVSKGGENIGNNTKTVMDYIPSAISEALTGSNKTFTNFLNNVGDNVSTFGNKVIQTWGAFLSSWIKNTARANADAFNSFVSFFKKLGSKMAKFLGISSNSDFGYQMPSGFGSNSFSVSTPNLSGPGLTGATFGAGATIPFMPLLPVFAAGGVVREPTLGLIGEYPGASTNPEIITPEQKMHDVFVSSMAPLAMSIHNDVERLIAVVERIDPILEIDGEVIGKTAQKYRENQFKRTGKVPV